MTRAAAMAVALCFFPLWPLQWPPISLRRPRQRLPRASSMILVLWVWLRARS